MNSEKKEKTARQCNRKKMRIPEKENWERKEHIERGTYGVLIQKIIRIRLNISNQTWGF